MNEREPRTRVLLPARARWGGPWIHGSIQNVSAHGLMFSSTMPPPLGAYVEVMVGSLSITARTVWINGVACGLKARSPIDFERLRDRRTDPSPKSANKEFAGPDRRTASPPPDYRQMAERSRHTGRFFQYGTFAAVALAVAGSLGWEIYQTLSVPLNKVSVAMAGGQ